MNEVGSPCLSFSFLSFVAVFVAVHVGALLTDQIDRRLSLLDLMIIHIGDGCRCTTIMLSECHVVCVALVVMFSLSLSLALSRSLDHHQRSRYRRDGGVELHHGNRRPSKTQHHTQLFCFDLVVSWRWDQLDQTNLGSRALTDLPFQ